MQPHTNNRKRVIVLGATGTIGDATFRVIRAMPECFDVVGIASGNNTEKLAALAREFSVPAVAAACVGKLAKEQLPAKCSLYEGADAALRLVAHEADLVVAGITGVAGLPAVMRAAELGRTIALANKESLVCAGHLVMEAARKSGATILPVDSEHNAIFQAMQGQDVSRIASITLTASGGPFRTLPLEALKMVTPEQAVKHPKWNMGAKISVDSATMMNKGLELIEAHVLFALPERQIQVVIHPEAVIHGCVEYADGSTLAQLCPPDMAVPISYCMHWPNRGNMPLKPLSLAALGQLTFEAVEDTRYPALSLARQALNAGPAAMITLNAANEIAVDAFLKRSIGFCDIIPLVRRQLDAISTDGVQSLGDALALDQHIRAQTLETLTLTETHYA
jgi:1-deoxy-D-xylulose-5-phosphate reductoisomerase